MAETRTSDIVELLLEDHDEAKALLREITSAAPDSRGELFVKLVPELVRHEVAEEIVVYPTIRAEAPDGKDEVAPRLEEQAEAEELLADMERDDRSSAEFGQKLQKLHDAVLAHAAAEEENIFPLLRAIEDTETRAELGARYEKAKAAAPTHPHPHAPDTPPGNMVLGPIAALFDKARDAAKGI
jgi:hemerythrin superfamily protein